MTPLPTAPFLFVIDTDSYAGNFERELCAFITGRLGECRVGYNEQQAFLKETQMEPFGNVLDMADERGCRRPAACYPTPNWFTYGMGKCFEGGNPDIEAQARVEFAQDVESYNANEITRLKAVLQTWETGTEAEKAALTTPQELCRARIAYLKQKNEDAKTPAKITRYQAYQSVAIGFATRPTEAQIALMKKRSADFAPLQPRFGPSPNIKTILGFRIVASTVTSRETPV